MIQDDSKSNGIQIHPRKERAQQASRIPLTPVPVLPSKTRLKLTAADRERKMQLEDDLLETESALLEAYEEFRAGSGEWRKVQRLDHDYRQVIDAANEFIFAIHGDQHNYLSGQSKNWLKSEKGQAYAQWMDEWDVEISSGELPEPGLVCELELDALEMFQDLPDEPSA
jgi:hypothetical protein